MKIFQKIKRIPWNSIRVKVVIILIVLILPLVSLLLYNSYYSINVIQNQVAHSNKNLLALYMQQIDTSLLEIEKYLIRLSAFNDDLTIFEDFNNRDQYELAKIRLKNTISEDILNYSNLNSIFIYSMDNQDLLEIYNDQGSFTERENIRLYLEKLFEDNLNFLNKWYHEKINGNYYLFRVLKFGDAYLGAWLDVEKLEVPLNLINLGEKGRSFFVTNQGVPMIKEDILGKYDITIEFNNQNYYISGKKDKFLIVTEESENGDFSLMALIPTEKILENLPYLQNLITIVVIITILLIPLSLLLVKISVIDPLNKILKVMEKVKKDGNLYERIENTDFISDEIQIINTTFNKMMDNIQRLRIDVYEEKLAKQKFELQNLQLQVKPHFFLNTLNIIYSLSKTKNYKKIQEIIQLLVHYFRYMFRSEMNMVLLKDEIKHVQNYIKIQQIRFPDALDYKIDVPEEILEISVPPLIIQTFTENIIKHAVTLDNRIYFEIKIEKMENEDKVRIIIKDNGTGFPEDLLLKLNSEADISNAYGEHIGIYNVKQRLHLLYGDNASILFENDKCTGGAVIKIILPYMNQGG